MCESDRLCRRTAYSLRLPICALAALVATHGYASDVFQSVPSGVAVVIVIPNLAETSARFNKYFARSFPGAVGLVPDELEAGFRLPAGTVDFTKPVLVVSGQPALNEMTRVLVFTPADPSAIRRRVNGLDEIVRTCDGLGGRYMLMTRKGTALVGLKRSALRAIRAENCERFLSDSLSPDERKLIADNDVLVHLSMAKWRESLSNAMRLMSGFVKFGLAGTSNAEDCEEAATMFDWFRDGTTRLVDHMDSLNAALSFDGEFFRLTHHHTFVPGSPTATYLAQVKTRGGDLLEYIPDQRFLALVTINWNCPGKETITYQMMKHLLDGEAVARRIPAETRAKLLESTCDYYGGLTGSSVVVATSPGQFSPISICGVDELDNSQKALERLQFIQENASDVFGVFMPGVGAKGMKFEKRTVAGQDMLEMDICANTLPESIQSEMASVYGRKARFQLACHGKDKVLFTMSEPPLSTEAWLKGEKFKPISENPEVRTILRQLPAKPNAVIVCDLGTTLSAVPALARTSLGDGRAHAATERVSNVRLNYPSTAGPMAGWACVVGEASLTGQFVLSGDGLAKSLKLARQMAVEVAKASPSQPIPPLPPAAPVPAAPSRPRR